MKGRGGVGTSGKVGHEGEGILGNSVVLYDKFISVYRQLKWLYQSFRSLPPNVVTHYSGI